MIAVAHISNDTRDSYRNSLVGIELNEHRRRCSYPSLESIASSLLSIAQTSTTLERRQEIIEEIQSLRSIRDDLIAE